MQSARQQDPTTILQITISGIGLVFSILAAALLALVGLSGILASNGAPAQSVTLLSLAWVAALAAALSIPSILFGIMRLAGKKLPEAARELGSIFTPYRLAWVLLLLWPLALASGVFLSKNARVAWLVLPPLDLLAIGIPIYWLVALATRKLPAGRAQRKWGLVNFTIFLSFPVVFVAEIVGMASLIAFFIIALIGHPEWLAELQRLSIRLQALRNSPENLFPILQPFLMNPIVLYAIFTLYSGMAPLVEEMLKPLAIWALAGRKITPAEGFAAGALCGATFALVESLLNLVGGSAGNDWLTLVVGRFGTGLLHITTTALMGWALAYAWRYGAYLRLALTYLLAVALHGLWNGVSVVMIFKAIPPGSIAASMQWVAGLANYGPEALATLAALFFLLLMFNNYRLRKMENDSHGMDQTTP